jgi:hypothetical protein
MADLYDTDIVLWAEQQAKALRRRLSNELDWDNVAEEIEALAANQKREVRSRLRVICEHLLKWQHLRQYDFSGQSWLNTLIEQRRALEDLFADSPSLRRFAAEDALQRAYGNARVDVERKTGRSLGLENDLCPWSFEEVLSLDFPPDSAIGQP